MSVRDRLVALALSYENVGVGTNRAKYVALLSSADPADHTAQMQAYFADPRTSGCALTVRGLWRAMGLSDPLLGAYRVGHAVLDVLTIAKQYGAFVEERALARLPATTGSYAPQIGDMIYVAAPEHVATIVAVSGDLASGYELTTIDGGQSIPDAHGQLQQCITKRFRSWKMGGGLLRDLPKFGGSAKQVMGVVDVSRLPFPVPQSELQSCPTERAPTSER